MLEVAALISMALAPPAAAPASVRSRPLAALVAAAFVPGDETGGDETGGDETGRKAAGKRAGAPAEEEEPAVRRRVAPRVSKVRCAPVVCQANCPVVKTVAGDDEPGGEAATKARLARASASEKPCAQSAAAATGRDKSL